MATFSAGCVAFSALFAAGVGRSWGEALDGGVQLVEVRTHELSNFRSTPSSVAADAVATLSPSRMMRRESFSQVEQRMEKYEDEEEGEERSEEAAHFNWGGYGMDYIVKSWKCKESESCVEWSNCSWLGLWSGSEGSLTLTSSHIMNHGFLMEGSKGLLLYKAACSVNVTRVVGVTMSFIPLTAELIDIVFGITRQCTGLCAPFTVAVLDGASSLTKHRWCFNHEGNETEVQCDEDIVVPHDKWHRVTLNITQFTDYTTPLKLELAVYTNGDFRFEPALGGQVGIGSRALTIIDTLIFRPASLPRPSGNYKSLASACSESQAEICDVNSWCWEKYRCMEGWCVEGKGRCNYIRNCNDDSDEVGCEYALGLLGRFFFTHGLDITSASFKHDSLSKPDIVRLHEKVSYDANDWNKEFGVTDYFAAHWQGNITIGLPGHYYFMFQSSGNATLQLFGLGDNAGMDHNATSGAHISLASGMYQVFLKFVHTTGQPNIEFKWRGPDTNEEYEIVPESKTTAVMTGSRCDLLACHEGLISKPGKSDILCAGVPCEESIDTSTCCQRQYKKVVAGKYHTCALTMDGKPVCWGSWRGTLQEWKNHNGPFMDIDTYDKYTCGIVQGLLTLDCWQRDSLSTTEIDYSIGSIFTNISIGGYHTCGLRDNGYIGCTGSNAHFQDQAPSDVTFVSVTSGEEFSCGILFKNRGVRCWGRNEHGQVGDVPNTLGFTHLSAGLQHVCGVYGGNTGGKLWCWGLNDNNQATPPEGSDYRTVEAGGEHSCALKTDGNVVCWGSNAKGQASPRADDMPMSQISAGQLHTCGLRAADNIVVCWGSNFEPRETGNDIWRGQSLPPPASATWPPGGPPDYPE
mmetsp:Transcript_65877/g.121436  ORF Transcript_65877/g.121436 Transcript_65877/m.121436 type:complete len:859 (-) Transcript_65877:27-2603(-)